MRCLAIGLKFKGWGRWKQAFLRDIDIVVPIALLDTMDYFHQATNPLVPIDTGKLRESFTSYLVDSREIQGKWDAVNDLNDFPYGAYQYFNHGSMNYWIEKSIALNGENMRLIFADTVAKGMSRWTS